MASCQMEYKYLAHLTGRKEYFQTVERVMDIMQKHQAPNGLLATNWNVFNGTPIAGKYSVTVYGMFP